MLYLDRPLPIPSLIITERTNTSLRIKWKDDNYNQNANITFYQLILKFSNLIQSRILVNRTISNYTFTSLYPGTKYSIEIFAIDAWNRSSSSKILTSQTLVVNSSGSNRIIDSHLLDRSIFCYNLNDEYLFIEFNHSKFYQFNHIYNLTIFNNQNQLVFTSNIYSSFFYSIKNVNLKYQILLMISTNQSEYLGKISKICQDFSPIICSVRLINRNRYHLTVQKRSENILQPRKIFYRTNENSLMEKNIHQLSLRTNITNVRDNYSIIVENNFLNEKFNISIPCSIHRIGLENFSFIFFFYSSII